MDIEYGETPQAKHIHKTPDEVHVQFASKGAKARHFSKRQRNSKRVALFFKGARDGRGAVGRYDNCFRGPWGTNQSRDGTVE